MYSLLKWTKSLLDLHRQICSFPVQYLTFEFHKIPLELCEPAFQTNRDKMLACLRATDSSSIAWIHTLPSTGLR